MKKIVMLLFSLFYIGINAQEYFPANDGVKTNNKVTTAFTNATIYVSPNRVIKKGTLVIQDGKVLAVGNNLNIPKDAQINDLNGKFIYPSFIDLYSDFGIEKPKAERRSGTPQYNATREGYYWNDHIKPDTNPLQFFKFNDKAAKDLLKAGFGAVNTHMQDGIIRGTGMLVALNPNSTDAYRIIESKSAQYLSFRKSVLSNQAYPNSLMGAMALIRQVYYDAVWYANGNANNKDLALEAINANKNLMQIFVAESKLNALRADKLGDEFSIQYTILGGGDEYENIDEIKQTNANFIIPVNFRKAYDVSNPLITSQMDLSDMRKWNQEPSNLNVLHKNGVQFSITANGLKNLDDFQKNIAKAITYGLDKKAALAALTTIPAKIIGKSDLLGTLDKGRYANFLITSGELFEKETVIYENWVQGQKNSLTAIEAIDASGLYDLTFNGENFELKIEGDALKPKASVTQGETKIKSSFSIKDNWITLTLNNTNNASKFAQLVGAVLVPTNTLKGIGYTSEGKEMTWLAVKKIAENNEKTIDKNVKPTAVPMVMPVTYPNMAFGFKEKPKQETILFKNATVWTNENDGIVENTDVLIKDGKIAQIGKNLKAANAKVVDASGKHLTSGIIDEHSHIAASAINEAGHNSSAEVTIEDVVDPDDIQIYRSLAGGVTVVQILHGSANPIGGRSALIKLKWGESANGLLFKNTDKFIKFALGENVKQSRSTNGTRFPQSRMGVEQVFVDYFQRAKEYDANKKSGQPYRKDLEMETIAEILNGERFITCHSYVQSEINMLMKVAEQFNFNVATFTHILEGYKVADKMKAHGVGASTFSDWWAYKYEVNDAIPYNAAILHNMGIVTAINSDDAEMNRRLNQEAAKTIKYGGVSEEDAWKFVTLNPAKLLHIDDKVGSIKVGKDADLVLWNTNPLSIYAKAEKTLIEGVVYFDIERDLQLREAVIKERNTLINLMLNEKLNGNETQMPKKNSPRDFHCDTVTNY